MLFFSKSTPRVQNSQVSTNGSKAKDPKQSSCAFLNPPIKSSKSNSQLSLSSRTSSNQAISPTQAPRLEPQRSSHSCHPNINFHKTLPFDPVSLEFLCYFLFWEERDIKFEQKYLFTPDFNRGELQKTNETYHRWVKKYFSNHG